MIFTGCDGWVLTRDISQVKGADGTADEGEHQLIGFALGASVDFGFAHFGIPPCPHWKGPEFPDPFSLAPSRGDAALPGTAEETE